MLTVGQEGSQPIEINVDSDIRAVTFTADGKYIVSGDGDQIRVWGAEDGKQMATIAAWDIQCQCLAVSQDGRWIAAGTGNGYVFVWDTTTYSTVLSHWEGLRDILAVDFSPDSTRLVTASKNRRATVRDVTTCEPVLTLDHEDWVIGAKYSSQGDRIATATFGSVRVWDSDDGRLLLDIPVKVTPLFNTGLLWSNNHLFVVSTNKIKEFEASTGSEVSEWLVPDSNSNSCISLPKHGKFIAYSTKDTVTFWDTSTHAQLGLIQQPQAICSIVLAPDLRFLVTGGRGGKISIPSLSRITVSIVFFGLSRI
jgi:WD40 repeat protein